MSNQELSDPLAVIGPLSFINGFDWLMLKNDPPFLATGTRGAHTQVSCD